jgi:hypothetical protein
VKISRLASVKPACPVPPECEPETGTLYRRVAPYKRKADDDDNDDDGNHHDKITMIVMIKKLNTASLMMMMMATMMVFLFCQRNVS